MNSFQKRFYLFITVILISQSILYSQEKVKEVNFSVQRGFFTDSFYVTLSCETVGANINYTLNGAAPSVIYGNSYKDAILIDNTTILRAVAYKTGLFSSDIITQTYIFLDSIITQPINPGGFPSKWINNTSRSVDADYEMDPEYPESNSVVLNSLKSLPAVSIVMDVNDLFGRSGFHNNGGRNDNAQWERAGSVEFIFGDSTENYQVNAGVQPRGNGIFACRKRGFRVDFKEMYGPGKLEFPVFKNACDTTVKATKKFDSVIMRPGHMENYAGTGYNPFKNIYIRDPMIRDLQLNISGYGTHNLWVHMYFNGLYWGIFDLTEDVESDMLTEYFGGKEEDWLIAKANSIDHPTGGIVEGNPDHYLEFLKFIDTEDFTNSNTYQKVQQYIDVKDFAEYIIIYSFFGVGDWPDNNWIFAIHGGAKPIPGRFYSWDAEKTLLENDDPQAYKHAWYSPYLTNPDLWSGKAYISPPSRVWRSLIKNSDFRMLFADLSYQLMSNDGRLTDENMVKWIDKYTNMVKVPLLADQKRWSDDNRRSNSPGRVFTYADVQAEINRVKVNIINNVAKYKAAFRPYNLYPNTEPPKFSQQGGKVQNNYSLSIRNPNTAGSIYYTTDCTDPRLSGGIVSPNAIQSIDSVRFNIQKTVTVKARILKNGEWSPLNEATFLTPTGSSGLILTEIMYHPDEIGDSDGDNYEFIELKNTSSEDINLSKYSFTSGIWYVFPDGAHIKPNQFILLAKDSIKFEKKYDFAPDGVFTGNLSNGGDSLVLQDPFNNLTFSMVYDDSIPWPIYADSGKYSLVTNYTDTNPNPENPESWRLSHRIGGSPGKDDLVYEKQNYGDLLITEIMYNPLDMLPVDGDQLEFIEIKNTGTETVNMAGVHFTDGIEYTFYQDKLIHPGEFIVLVKENPSFFTRYGFYGDGEYAKNLSNDGESIILSDPYDNIIFSVEYGIAGGWTPKAHGDGYSLVPVKFNGNSMPNNPDNWRASLQVNGSPGRDDIFVQTSQNQFEFDKEKVQLKNFPNPFTNSTTISFVLEETSDISLQIFNHSGQLIEDLLNQQMDKGEHSIEWNSSRNSPGIYIIKLQTREITVLHKCSLIR